MSICLQIKGVLVIHLIWLGRKKFCTSSNKRVQCYRTTCSIFCWICKISFAKPMTMKIMVMANLSILCQRSYSPLMGGEYFNQSACFVAQNIYIFNNDDICFSQWEPLSDCVRFLQLFKISVKSFYHFFVIPINYQRYKELYLFWS